MLKFYFLCYFLGPLSTLFIFINIHGKLLKLDHFVGNSIGFRWIYRVIIQVTPSLPNLLPRDRVYEHRDHDSGDFTQLVIRRRDRDDGFLRA